MSTREMAYEIIDSMSEEQLNYFIMFFQSMFDEIPNEETAAALAESERMLKDPTTKKFNSVEELFEELDS